MAREDERPTDRDEAREPRHDPHTMGGDIGPASVRGSNVRPGGGSEDEGAPASGRAEPAANVAGRDDEWPVTAGSADKEGAPRADETEGRDLTVGSDSAGETAYGDGRDDEREPRR